MLITRLCLSYLLRFIVPLVWMVGPEGKAGASCCCLRRLGWGEPCYPAEQVKARFATSWEKKQKGAWNCSDNFVSGCQLICTLRETSGGFSRSKCEPCGIPLPPLSSTAAGETTAMPGQPRLCSPRAALGRAAWLQGAVTLNFSTARFSAACNCVCI